MPNTNKQNAKKQTFRRKIDGHIFEATTDSLRQGERLSEMNTWHSPECGPLFKSNDEAEIFISSIPDDLNGAMKACFAKRREFCYYVITCEMGPTFYLDREWESDESSEHFCGEWIDNIESAWTTYSIESARAMLTKIRAKEVDGAESACIEVVTHRRIVE